MLCYCPEISLTPSYTETVLVLVCAGGDGGQVFDNKAYGTLIWGMKLFGLPPNIAAKHEAWAPLGVVQGPNEPGNLGSIFSSLNEFFSAHDPGAGGATLCTRRTAATLVCSPYTPCPSPYNACFQVPQAPPL